MTADRPIELLEGDECLSVRDGRLAIDGLALTEIAQRFGTPVYVVSENQLRLNARAITAAFSERWREGPVLVMPSIKANLALALRRILTEEGTGCDAFGAAELEAALRSGVDPGSISVNGSTKDAELVERAIGAGARITLDSLAELERAREVAGTLGTTAEVRLRLRPWLELDRQTELLADPVSIAVATQRYKPGIPTEQLLTVPREAIESPQLDVRGVMAHIGRQGRDPAIWAELARRVAELVGRLGELWDGWRPREIDLGGGFPIPRDPFGRANGDDRDRGEALPSIDDYAEAITRGLRDGLERAGIGARGIQLEVEPGRSLYGNAGIHLATVRHVKSQSEPIPHTWVETDTSEIFLADVVFERNRWTAVVANRAAEPLSQTADITGISCNPDVIVPHARLPQVEPGDVIAFLDTGAYQDANASNFNALPRPATVLVNDGDAEVIKRGETIDDVFARDRVPARLRPGTSTAAVRGLDHVSVTCGDLERSLGFYAELLGIPVRDRGEAEGGEIAAISGVDAPVRWADLDLGGGQVLELLQYLIPDARPSAGRLFDPGSGHLSLRVESAADAYETLRAAGVELRSEPVELTEPGHWHGARCFYAVDPDGVVVEIIERP